MYGPYIVSYIRAVQSKPLKKSWDLILSKVIAPRCLGFFKSKEFIRFLALSSFMNFGYVTLYFFIAV